MKKYFSENLALGKERRITMRNAGKMSEENIKRLKKCY